MTATSKGVRIKPSAGELLIRKLSLRTALTQAECDVLFELPCTERLFSARDYLALEGERLEHSVIILDGMASRSKVTVEGRRQNVSLHIAGDFIDLQSAVMKVSDHDIVAIGPLRIATVPHEALLQTSAAHPGIAMALWRETLADAAIAREWVLNVGQREAHGRVAHLLCEMSVRFEAIDIFDRHRFVMPLTQQELGDTTGLTPVHINRTLKRMRTEGLIATHGFEVCVDDWDALAEAGGFDASYLYLPDEGRAGGRLTAAQ